MSADPVLTIALTGLTTRLVSSAFDVFTAGHSALVFGVLEGAAIHYVLQEYGVTDEGVLGFGARVLGDLAIWRNPRDTGHALLGSAVGLVIASTAATVLNRRREQENKATRRRVRSSSSRSPILLDRPPLHDSPTTRLANSLQSPRVNFLSPPTVSSPSNRHVIRITPATSPSTTRVDAEEDSLPDVSEWGLDGPDSYGGTNGRDISPSLSETSETEYASMAPSSIPATLGLRENIVVLPPRGPDAQSPQDASSPDPPPIAQAQFFLVEEPVVVDDNGVLFPVAKVNGDSFAHISEVEQTPSTTTRKVESSIEVSPDPDPVASEVTQEPDPTVVVTTEDHEVKLTKAELLAHAQALRSQARESEKEAQRLEGERQGALKRRRSREAFRLKHEAKAAQSAAKQLHQEAKDAYLLANNSNNSKDTVDLHGLTVSEALTKVDEALRDLQLAGGSTLRVITGKGKNSAGMIAQLRPAILKEMNNQKIACRFEVKNDGVLIIDLFDDY